MYWWRGREGLGGLGGVGQGAGRGRVLMADQPERTPRPGRRRTCRMLGSVRACAGGGTHASVQHARGTHRGIADNCTSPPEVGLRTERWTE